MEIRSTIADDSNASALRIDITRKNRESIESRQPLLPRPEDLAKPDDPLTHAQKIKEARDEYREQHQARIANARLNYTENRAEDILSARTAYNARIDKANQRRIENTQPPPASDSAELSSASQVLAALDSAHVDEQRAVRVAELKELYAQNALPSDDLIARTAYRLLSGE